MIKHHHSVSIRKLTIWRPPSEHWQVCSVMKSIYQVFHRQNREDPVPYYLWVCQRVISIRRMIGVADIWNVIFSNNRYECWVTWWDFCKNIAQACVFCCNIKGWTALWESEGLWCKAQMSWRGCLIILPMTVRECHFGFHEAEQVQSGVHGVELAADRKLSFVLMLCLTVVGQKSDSVLFFLNH